MLCVEGKPLGQGSMRSVGQGRMIHSKGLVLWRQHIAARAVAQLWTPTDQPVVLEVSFHLPRPKGHYRRSGDLLPQVEHRMPGTRPDLDKLIRAVGDALTGVGWVDDSLIVAIDAHKTFARKDFVGMFAQRFEAITLQKKYDDDFFRK